MKEDFASFCSVEAGSCEAEESESETAQGAVDVAWRRLCRWPCGVDEEEAKDREFEDDDNVC